MTLFRVRASTVPTCASNAAKIHIIMRHEQKMKIVLLTLRK